MTANYGSASGASGATGLGLKTNRTAAVSSMSFLCV
jgi:hypothetical protein